MLSSECVLTPVQLKWWNCSGQLHDKRIGCQVVIITAYPTSCVIGVSKSLLTIYIGMGTPVWKWKHETNVYLTPNIISYHITHESNPWICQQLWFNETKKDRWDLVIAMPWNCLRLYFKWFASFRYLILCQNLDKLLEIIIYCFSLFVLFLLAEFGKQSTPFFAEDTDSVPPVLVYKTRINQIENICRKYGLEPGSVGDSSHDEEMNFIKIHSDYTSKVPDKVRCF